MSVIFKRKLYNRMLAWKNDRKGSTALLVKGARRVGKSTLVEQFAEQQYGHTMPKGWGVLINKLKEDKKKCPPLVR